jgi:putative nucleotidyltransferase with HDIG domain
VSFANLLGVRGRDLENVVAAGMLHDLGKSAVPHDILDKPARLDHAEWAVMRQHPHWGAQILAGSNWAPEIIDAVRHHHERLDGEGYPDGLSGARVPDLTRLVTIADVFSALIDKRAYKNKMSGQGAFEIMRGAEGHLDLDFVRAFTPIAMSVD